MKKGQYLITYHNQNTGRAIWLTEKYYFDTKDSKRYEVMKKTNEALGELRDPDIVEGIRLLLEYDGESVDKYN